MTIPPPATFTVRNLLDYRGSNCPVPLGRLTFRLYADGWMISFEPYSDTAGVSRQKIEGAAIWDACRFANDCLGAGPGEETA